MTAPVSDWTDARAKAFGNLESPLNELALRQRAIMLIAEDKLSVSGAVAFSEQMAESLYILLSEQREAISDLLDSYYTAPNCWGREHLPGDMGNFSHNRAVLVRIVEDLSHLRTDSEAVDQPLLASLIEMARSEAEDVLKTTTEEFERTSELKETSIASGRL